MAPIFKVSTLKFWRDKIFSEDMLKEAKDSIKSVYKFFFPNQKINQVKVESVPQTSSNGRNSIDGFFANQFLHDQRHEEMEDALISKDTLINKEIQDFIRTIDDLETLKELTTSKKFWNSNIKKFPNLRKLALILLNIPASSASIERYFSITGLICNKRAAKMNSTLLIWRGLLRANIKLLLDLNKKA